MLLFSPFFFSSFLVAVVLVLAGGLFVCFLLSLDSGVPVLVVAVAVVAIAVVAVAVVAVAFGNSSSNTVVVLQQQQKQ